MYKKSFSILAMLFCIVALLAGCGKEDNNNPVKPAAAIKKPVRIKFLGHSSFKITTADSIRIVTDPYGSTVSFLTWPDTVTADIVTISHAHADHNQTRAIKGNPVILKDGQVDTVGSIRISAYETRHGDWGTQKMGNNWIYIFQINDLKIVHLGETGPFDDGAIIAAIQDADVLLVPIGQIASLSFTEIKSLIDTAHTHVVIPHHFSLSPEQRYYGSSTVDEFVDFIGTAIPVEYHDVLDVYPDPARQIVVLDALFTK
jgi:L-ascorbate metabolism protein UlaG (beta-lactamase superfamily)